MTDEVKGAIAIIIVATVIYKGWVDYYREKKFSRYLSNTFFKNACESIQVLAQQAERLSQLEEMTEDIQRNPNDRSVRLRMPETLSGNLNNADVSCANPLALLEIIEPERDKLRSSLVENLYSILHYGVTVKDYNDMKEKYDMRSRGGLPSDVLFVDHKTGFHYRDGFISNPDGDFQASRYNSLTDAQKKILEQQRYKGGTEQ